MALFFSHFCAEKKSTHTDIDGTSNIKERNSRT